MVQSLSRSVWDQFRQLLQGGSDPATQADAQRRKTRIAAAVLLLELERVDAHRSEREREVVKAQLQQKFGLDADETETLVQVADQRAARAVSLHRFVQTLNEHLDAEQKLAVLEMLWQVAYADGELEKHEEAFLREMSELMFIPHADFIRVKLRVLDEI